MESAALLEGLDEAQRAAVVSDAAPLCILAGAGSGKTRVLTRRIAHRCATDTADPRHVLALTFTRKAAGELGQRLRSLGLRDGVAAGTFHAIAYGQLRTRWADLGVPAPTLLERKGRLLARIVPRPAGQRQSKTADFATEIEWAKARMISPAHYAEAAGAAHRRAPIEHSAMAAIYRRYEEDKKKAGLVDFDDLLWQCVQALEADDLFRDAQRWRFRHLFVDEYQDVNPLQHRFLEVLRGGRPDLCVVGDPNQAIYTWNGADSSYLEDFTSFHPGAEVLVLDRNYRSSPQVLAVANAVLAAGASRTALKRLRATRADSPIPEVRSFTSDRHEARAIARAAHDLHAPGVPWSHQAVLTRTHAQGVILEQAFRAASIPFRLRGRTPFLDVPEVKEALVRLTRARLPLAEAVSDLDFEIQQSAAADNGPADGEAERLANLENLVRLAREYLSGDRIANPAGLQAWLTATVRAEETDGPRDAVDIGTFHAAKGLEWPIVHIAGLESGLVPIGHAKSPEAEAEERRLLYVGITRAERILRCSWAQTRMFGDRVGNRSPSPYLVEVEAVLEALRNGTRPEDWRPHIARQRDQLRLAGTATKAKSGSSPLDTDAADLLRALKQWRAQAAKAAAVPAYVIFHDSTLEAVARSRPLTAAALLRLPGIGPVKANRFGDDVLSLVASHAG